MSIVMQPFTPFQPSFVFLCRMRPDSLQTWKIILFDLNLCRKKFFTLEECLFLISAENI